MGLVSSIAAGFESKADDNIRYGILDIWKDLFGGAPVKSGVTVSVQSALQTTTVLGCVRRITEALTVPCKLYQKDPRTKSREEAQSHPLFDMLSDEPNGLQDGYGYRETLAMHLALCFNHYSFISRVD